MIFLDGTHILIFLMFYHNIDCTLLMTFFIGQYCIKSMLSSNFLWNQLLQFSFLRLIRSKSWLDRWIFHFLINNRGLWFFIKIRNVIHKASCLRSRLRSHSKVFCLCSASKWMKLNWRSMRSRLFYSLSSFGFVF